MLPINRPAPPKELIPAFYGPLDGALIELEGEYLESFQYEGHTYQLMLWRDANGQKELRYKHVGKK